MLESKQQSVYSCCVIKPPQQRQEQFHSFTHTWTIPSIIDEECCVLHMTISCWARQTQKKSIWRDGDPSDREYTKTTQQDKAKIQDLSCTTGFFFSTGATTAGKGPLRGHLRRSRERNLRSDRALRERQTLKSVKQKQQPGTSFQEGLMRRDQGSREVEDCREGKTCGKH